MKRLLPFVLLIVLFLAGVVSVVFFLNPERHRTEITELLSKVLKRPVIVGPLSMSYFPPTLHLSQMAVMKDGGNPGLEIETTSAPLDLKSLLQLKLVPSVLQFSHWKLLISRNKDGHWDIEDWLTGASSGAMSHPSYLLNWTDGEIHWADPYTNPPQELVLGTVTGAWDPGKHNLIAGGDFGGFGSPAHLTLSANGEFASPAQWSGDLQLTDRGESCTIHMDDKDGQWDVKGGAPQYPLDNALSFLKFYGRSQATNVEPDKALELQQWQFRVTGNSSRLSFEHTAGISGGLSEAKGILSWGSGSVTANLKEGAAKDVPVEAFRAIAGGSLSLSGQVTGVTQNLQLTLSSGTPILQSGEGYFQITNGHYGIPDDSMKRLSRAKTMAYINKKFLDLQTSGFPITRLSAHWQIKDSLITINDGLLLSNNIKVGWAGKIDSSKEGIDATIRLEIHEKDPKLLSLIPFRYHAAPAFGRFQGTWKEWVLRAVPASKIPSAIQAKLRRAINQK
jgi:hypothetical protein